MTPPLPEESSPLLVCPSCRHARGGDLHVRTLAAHGGLLACACGARYPVVDGVPLLFRDLDGWLASEAGEAMRRLDLPDDVAERIVTGAGGRFAQRAARLATYRRSREGALQDWLRARVTALPGVVLELGAGLGACDRPDVVALDHDLSVLRYHPGRRVCADAADPPFLPASFDAIVLPNLLDSCADPGLVLAQADALLRPGGLLVVTCAYAFEDTITPRARRFTPSELSRALGGAATDQPSEARTFGGYPLAYDPVEERDRLAWPLHLGDRVVHTHAAHALVGRKAG